jgi:hypothetical protein
LRQRWCSQRSPAWASRLLSTWIKLRERRPAWITSWKIHYIYKSRMLE